VVHLASNLNEIFVVSNASFKNNGGKNIGNRFANMVLPAPGGPIKMNCVPQLLRISNARFNISCSFYI